MRLLDEGRRSLERELTTVRLASDDEWTSLDAHLVAAASERVRRRSTALSLLALAVTIGGILLTLQGATPPTTGWLVTLSVVGVVAAVGALYLSRDPTGQPR